MSDDIKKPEDVEQQDLVDNTDEQKASLDTSVDEQGNSTEENNDMRPQTAEADITALAKELPKSQESDSESGRKEWYVIHAFSGAEEQVRKLLETKIVKHGLQDKFDGIFVPKESVMEVRAGKKKSSERKFFPGYVLVKMVMDDETWHLVREVPKVLGFIGGTSAKPAPISEREAQAIFNRIEEGTNKPKPKVLYEPGEVVRVTDGPFSDFNGVVEEVNYEKNRLRVAVLIFGRSTPVELEFGQVEKA